jgi:hypothetical protein
MAKKLENMTADERIAYWENERRKAYINRQDRINKLNFDQRVALADLHSKLQTVLDTALDVDMGGIKAISLFEMQELQYAADKLHFEFNLGKHLLDENS